MQGSRLLLQSELRQEGYACKMLQNNSIQGLLPCRLRFMDGAIQLCFEYDTELALKELYEHVPMSAENIENIILDIITIIDDSRTYLLDENDFLVVPDYIYYSKEKQEVRLCYLPGYNEPLKKQFSILFDFMMNHIDYTDQKAVVFAYMLYNKSREENCTFQQIRLMLKEHNDKKFEFVSDSKANCKSECILSNNPGIDTSGKDNRQQAEGKRVADELSSLQMFTERIEEKKSEGNEKVSERKNRFQNNKGSKDYKENIFQQLQSYISNIIRGSSKRVEGDCRSKKSEKNYRENSSKENGSREQKMKDTKAFLLEREEMKTVLINSNVMSCCFCLRPLDERGKEIIITTTPFFIGKDDANVHAGLSDRTVSRLHARLSVRQEQCYLEDLHSTNGSFVNGTRIEDGPILLSLDDEIAFADTKYIFTKL